MKVCARCDQSKEDEDFYVDTHNGGLSSYCRPCQGEYQREYRQRRPEVVRQSALRRRREGYVRPAPTQEMLERKNLVQRERLRLTPVERRRLTRIRQAYHLTIEDYEEMLERQGGCCAICKRPPPPGRHLEIDHDHRCCPQGARSCGQCVRGLLCKSCNVKLALLEDPEVRDAALAYLGFRLEESELLTT